MNIFFQSFQTSDFYTLVCFYSIAKSKSEIRYSNTIICCTIIVSVFNSVTYCKAKLNFQHQNGWPQKWSQHSKSENIIFTDWGQGLPNMKHINKMLIEANLSSLPMTLTSWSLHSHLVSLTHFSVWFTMGIQKMLDQCWKEVIINAGNKLCIKFGLKLAGKMWLSRLMQSRKF